MVILKKAVLGSCLVCVWIPVTAEYSDAAVADAQVSTITSIDVTADTEDLSIDTRAAMAPDIREDELPVKIRQGDFVAVPIPISDPTLGDGLVAGGAYFYPQSADEAERQPASMTAVAGLATSNGSRAFGLGQQNYWLDNRWRFTGAVGQADLSLSLLTPQEGTNTGALDWSIKGRFLFAKLARKIAGNWYGGTFIRAIDASQRFESSVDSPVFDTSASILSIGPGLLIEYDSRDNPLNSTRGRYVTVDGLFNDESLGSDASYQSYSLGYRSYHALAEKLVLALDAQSCKRVGAAPLWDACTLKLRGFPVTDYLGRSAASIQAESRWQVSERWGIVAFAGTGYVGNSFSDRNKNETVPSYGAGLRFMVLPEKRINLRLDYARSDDSEAIYISVGEAF